MSNESDFEPNIDDLAARYLDGDLDASQVGELESVAGFPEAVAAQRLAKSALSSLSSEHLAQPDPDVAMAQINKALGLDVVGQEDPDSLSLTIDPAADAADASGASGAAAGAFSAAASPKGNEDAEIISLDSEEWPSDLGEPKGFERHRRVSPRALVALVAFVIISIFALTRVNTGDDSVASSSPETSNTIGEESEDEAQARAIGEAQFGSGTTETAGGEQDSAEPKASSSGPSELGAAAIPAPHGAGTDPAVGEHGVASDTAEAEHGPQTAQLGPKAKMAPPPAASDMPTFHPLALDFGEFDSVEQLKAQTEEFLISSSTSSYEEIPILVNCQGSIDQLPLFDENGADYPQSLLGLARIEGRLVEIHMHSSDNQIMITDQSTCEIQD